MLGKEQVVEIHPFPYESTRKWGKQYVSTIIISWAMRVWWLSHYPGDLGYLRISQHFRPILFPGIGAVMGYPLILDFCLLGPLLSGCAPRPGPYWKSAPGHDGCIWATPVTLETSILREYPCDWGRLQKFGKPPHLGIRLFCNLPLPRLEIGGIKAPTQISDASGPLRGQPTELFFAFNATFAPEMLVMRKGGQYACTSNGPAAIH